MTTLLLLAALDLGLSLRSYPLALQQALYLSPLLIFVTCQITIVLSTSYSPSSRYFSLFLTLLLVLVHCQIMGTRIRKRLGTDPPSFFSEFKA